MHVPAPDRCRQDYIATILFFGLMLFPSLPTPAMDTSIRVLSSRADMVSGDSALVAITPKLPTSSVPRITLNGAEVTSSFVDREGVLVGLVRGLRLGRNVLTASAGGSTLSLIVTDHGRNGPIFSGPQQAPFVCETERFILPDGSTLGDAQDQFCNVPSRINFVYKSSLDNQFKPFDIALPRPTDLATTVTIEGKRVDYIVRVETGTVNRAIYQIAMLFDPEHDDAPTPFGHYSGWNGKLVFLFGGSASAGYRQGTGVGSLMTILDDVRLSMGFAVAGSTLNVFGQSANDVLSAETASMVKEIFVKSYGPPLYTMGWGGSGGSMSQYLVANNYPGLLDGIVPGGSFPDLHTVVPSAVDCSLLDREFKSNAGSWSDAQKAAVAGYATWNVCKSWMGLFAPNWLRADQVAVPPVMLGAHELDVANCGRAVPKDKTYDPIVNRAGARCDVYSAIRNSVGVDAKTGYALRAFDNVGVQYGLNAFLSGAISAEQFVLLNENAGGFDNDGRFMAKRSVGSTVAIRRMYRYGRVNETGNLRIPILDIRSDSAKTADLHDSLRSLTARARYTRLGGYSDNFIILRADAPPTVAGTGGTSGSPAMDLYALRSMDRWLSAIVNDERTYPTVSDKLRANRPSGLADACILRNGMRIEENAAVSALGQCGTLMPYYSNPRLVAGEPLTNDVLKCKLRPLKRVEYSSLSIGQFERLKKVFPSGICDYAKPPAGMGSLMSTWLSYPRPGKAIRARAF